MNISALEHELYDYCSRYDIFGQIRVTLKDDILLEFQHGMADRENGVPFSDASVFSFYSISKQFCSMAVMKLFEKGLLDLQSHPGKYLPEASAFNDRVTLWNLIHHTSGIPDCEQSEDFRRTHLPAVSSRIRSDIEELSHYPQMFEPETDALYINTGFVIASLIIENITGEPYEVFMQREILDPLGMQKASIDLEGKVIPGRVCGYEKDPETGCINPVPRCLNWMKGAGDVTGTVSDLYMLNREIKSPHVLQKSSWDIILSPESLNNKGMGCTITDWHGKKRITHNGGHIGFRTLHIQLPSDDFDIIMLSNSGFHNESRDDISEIIHRHMYWTGGSDGVIELDKGYI